MKLWYDYGIKTQTIHIYYDWYFTFQCRSSGRAYFPMHFFSSKSYLL
jgi:hypothetical protein